jgi:hypothetical protein
VEETACDFRPFTTDAANTGRDPYLAALPDEQGVLILESINKT